MTNQDLFDAFIEKSEDYSDLDILDQLSIFRGCSPFIEADIEKHFGKDFVINGKRAHLFNTNINAPDSLFVNWANIKKFETFVIEQRRIDTSNLF